MKSTSEQNWYIVYTKPFEEKKAMQFFFKKKIECYYPLRKVRNDYDNGYGKVNRITVEPLFYSRIFVHATSTELPFIKKIKSVISFVHWLDKPMIVKDEEIETIKKFLENYDEVIIKNIAVCTKSLPISLQITESLNTNNKKIAEIRLPALGWVLKAEMRPEKQVMPTILVQETHDSEFVRRFAI